MRKGKRMKVRVISLASAVVALAVMGVTAAFAGSGGNGTGAPSGAHFNLQIHGLNGGQGYNGSTKNNIFVPLKGSCKIMLTMGSPFQVIQNDCINNPPAEFQLPNPCGGTATTCDNFVYAVYVRALGKASANTEAASPTPPPTLPKRTARPARWWSA